MRQLTFSQRSKCHRLHSNYPNSSNKHRNVRVPLHLPLYTELQQPLNEFRLDLFAGMMKSNKILAEVASSEQSAVRAMVCMMETLPKLPTNWVDASAANLHKLMNPEKKKLYFKTETDTYLHARLKKLHLPRTAFYLHHLFCHKSLRVMLVTAWMEVW